MNLDTQQQLAVETESTRALVLAAAGSGKTRTLIERIAYLIEEKKVSPYEIMSFSFTRKASQEIRDRLVERIGNQAYHCHLGTMHSLALQMIQRFGDVIGLKGKQITVYGEWETQYLLKDVAMSLSLYNGKSWKIKKGDIDRVFEHYYQTGEEPTKDDPVHDLFVSFIARCKESNSMTYGGLLTGLRLLIPTMAKYLKIKHILVDEIQDIDTCHPPGTLIRKVTRGKGSGWGKGRKAITEDVPIETLKDGDFVLPWKRRWAKVAKNGKKIKVGKRQYTGNLIKITCGDKSVSVTPDHKVYAMMNGCGEDKYAVYLRWRSDRGFRVDMCRLRYCKDTKHKPLNGVGARFVEEGAEKGWILRVELTKEDVLIWEQVTSYNYGIPMTTFVGKDIASRRIDKRIINEIFSRTNGRGEECLKDYGLSFKYPLFIRENFTDRRKAPSKRYFETYAMNLIPEIMSLPGVEDYTQTKIDRIEKVPYSGIVYSLDVEDFHTYVANGLIVKNCQWKIINEMQTTFNASLFCVGDIDQSIYEFRGAVPQYLLDHADEFTIYRLQTNYRSRKSIVEAANKLIQHNQDRLPMEMVATRENTERNHLSFYRDMDSEKIIDIMIPKSIPITILARNHALLIKLDQLLEEAHIEHIYIGKDTALTNSEEFRRFHAFLKLIVNKFDNFSFLLIKDIIGLDAETYSRIRINAAQEGVSHFAVYLDEEETFEDEIYRAGDKFEDIVDRLPFAFAWPFDVKPIMQFIQKYIASVNSPTVQSYLDWLALIDIQDEIKEDYEGIVLMTIHAAKGLEWDTVIVAGCNEEILPSKQAIRNDDIEGERRLMYVAMTRAKDNLLLTCRPETTETNGRIYTNPESRFIKEVL
jgi:superfamily I DNA/RNA helicase